MSDRSPGAAAARLAALRARLYAPGSPETDRVRYEASLAQALHAEPGERAERAVPVVKNSASRVLALRRVGADEGLHGDADWSTAVGCSESFGYGNVSVDGRPSGFSTPAGETGARPTGTRFRLGIHLTRDANWSWVASGTRTGSDVQVVSVGAGAASSGPAQYAEFTARSTTVITAITIDATGTTPFLWQLQACTPD